MYSEIKYEGKQLKTGCIWIVGIEWVNDLFIDLSDHPLCPLSGISLFLLLGTKYRSTLSVGDCFRLGQTALSISDLHHSMLWMQQVLKQLNAGEYSTVSKVQVLNHLSDISFQLGDLYRAVDFTHQLLPLGNTLGS